MLPSNRIARLLFLVGICCCSVATAQVKTAIQTSVSPLAFSDYWGSPGFYVPNIPAKSIAIPETRLSPQFRSSEILRKLFPGAKYYKIPDVKSGGILWRSRDHESKILTEPSENKHRFPRPAGNYTVVNKLLRYADDDGLRWLLAVLESREVMPLDDMGCCIPDGADMSLALFKYDDSGWVLTNFTMITGNYGRWHTLADVSLEKLGRNNYGVSVNQYWRNPGGPSGGGKYYYGLVDGNYKKILALSSTRFSESACCVWDAKIKNVPTGVDFDDIRVVIASEYYKPGIKPDLPNYLDTAVTGLPKKVIKYVTPATDSFKYRITNLYSFNGKAYQLKRQSVSVKWKW